MYKRQKEIVDRKLEVAWSAWFNENAKTLPDELMIWLKRAGCGLLSFSPDHVDDRMLRNLQKNFKKEDLLYTVDVAKRHGMQVEYSFFLNSPGEDLRSLFEIFRFLGHARLELGPALRPFTLLLMQPIRIYPHTKLAEIARANGIIPEDHDLIEGQYWNPGALRHVVSAVQGGAGLAWRARRRWRALSGEGPAALAR